MANNIERRIPAAFGYRTGLTFLTGKVLVLVLVFVLELINFGLSHIFHFAGCLAYGVILFESRKMLSDSHSHSAFSRKGKRQSSE